VDPVAPVDPVVPVEPSDPVAPADPGAPADPADPSAPVDPGAPVDPEYPVVPGPGDPQDRDEGVEPAVPPVGSGPVVSHGPWLEDPDGGSVSGPSPETPVEPAAPADPTVAEDPADLAVGLDEVPPADLGPVGSEVGTEVDPSAVVLAPDQEVLSGDGDASVAGPPPVLQCPALATGPGTSISVPGVGAGPARVVNAPVRAPRSTDAAPRTATVPADISSPPPPPVVPPPAPAPVPVPVLPLPAPPPAPAAVAAASSCSPGTDQAGAVIGLPLVIDGSSATTHASGALGLVVQGPAAGVTALADSPGSRPD
jgi:hypothetical protein